MPDAGSRGDGLISMEDGLYLRFQESSTGVCLSGVGRAFPCVGLSIGVSWPSFLRVGVCLGEICLALFGAIVCFLGGRLSNWESVVFIARSRRIFARSRPRYFIGGYEGCVGFIFLCALEWSQMLGLGGWAYFCGRWSLWVR